MRQRPKFIFSDNSTNIIIEAFGKCIEDGLIVDSKTKEPILTPDNEEVEANKLCALKKGSEIFIKDDLYSIMKLSDNKY